LDYRQDDSKIETKIYANGPGLVIQHYFQPENSQADSEIIRWNESTMGELDKEPDLVFWKSTGAVGPVTYFWVGSRQLIIFLDLSNYIDYIVW
jgi:hypothetical protein